MSFVKALSTAQAREIDLTVISPRNYFLYTPLLPAVATGTVEERSIVEPVRKVLGGKGAYFEAVCHSIDPEAKKLVCWCVGFVFLLLLLRKRRKRGGKEKRVTRSLEVSRG